MKTIIFYCIVFILIFSHIICLNKEVYEDLDEYEFDYKNTKNAKNKSAPKVSTVNSTGINDTSATKPSNIDYDNYKDFQPMVAKSGTDIENFTQGMDVLKNNGENGSLQMMDQINSQIKANASNTGNITTTIRTTSAGLTSQQSTTGSTLITESSINRTTPIPLMTTPKVIKINVDLKTEPFVTLTTTTVSSLTSTLITPNITIATTNGFNITEQTSVTTRLENSSLQTYPEFPNNKSHNNSINKDFIQNITQISIEESNTTTTLSLESTELTIDPKFAKLLSNDDDITLPPDMEDSPSNDLSIGGIHSMQSFNLKPKGSHQPISPLLTNFPIYPIMPPKLPETPGFQTIWVPVQIRRDSHSVNDMWKRSKTPNFIERGHIKHEPTSSQGTAKSWWRKPRPQYCFEPIIVDYYCADRQALKKWSYNEADERCYRYIDYCSTKKLNSFNTLQDCLVSCWRSRV